MRRSRSSLSAAAALLAGLTVAAPAATAAPVLLPAGAQAILRGTDATTGVGSGVAGVGDFNGDGKPDWIAGGFTPDVTAWIVYDGGEPTVPAASPSLGSAGFVIRGGGGHFVSSAGDFNGDGLSDVVVGSRLLGGASVDERVITVVFGRKGASGGINLDALEPGQALRIKGYRPSSLALIGDVNGDGRSDIAVGDTAQAGGAGAVAVVLGRAAGGDVSIYDPAVAVRLVGENPPPAGSSTGDNVGGAVAPAADVNGDGVADIVVGASGAGGGAASVRHGRAFVVYGGPSLSPLVLDSDGIDPTRGFMITPPTDVFGEFGAAVAGVGDVTGDGLSEIAIAGPSTEKYRGHVWLVRGTRAAGTLKLSDPTAIAMDIAPPGAAGTPYEFFGSVLAGIGDVNGDLRPDLAVSTRGPARRVYAIHLGDGARADFDSSRELLAPAGRTVASPGSGSTDRFGQSLGGLPGTLLIGSPEVGASALDAAYAVRLAPGAAAPAAPPAPLSLAARLRPSSFAPGTGDGRGAKLQLKLSATGRVRASILRVRSGSRCSTATPSPLRACVPRLTAVTRLDLGTRPARAQTLAFSGVVRIAGRPRSLPAGKYVARLQASAGRRSSRVVTLPFTVTG